MYSSLGIWGGIPPLNVILLDELCNKFLTLPQTILVHLKVLQEVPLALAERVPSPQSVNLAVGYIIDSIFVCKGTDCKGGRKKKRGQEF